MAMPAFSPTQHRLPLILLVDDDPLVLRSLTRSLTGAGTQVMAVDDPEKALKMIANEELDCVICDIRMPSMSGLTFAKFVRAEQPDLPIVLMTGDPALDSALQAFELGILEYLPKPIDPPKLRETISRAVKLRKLARLRQEAANMIASEPPPDSGEEVMRMALDRAINSLFIVFQPIVDYVNRRVFGYEALLRTREPMLPYPPDVLDAAVKFGRDQELGRIIRERASQKILEAPADVLLFLNILPKDLDDLTLYESDSTLAAHAHRIVLEITERSDLGEVKDVVTRASRLRDLGFRLAVDDLGAGYAGLSSFAALEPEFTKLDMSLVRGIDASPVKRRVVGSMVALCRDLGSRVVGEGVETPQERDTLFELGCDVMQGYFFAKPAPPFPDIRWE